MIAKGLVFSLLALTAMGLNELDDPRFKAFQARFGKVYTTPDELRYRYQIYLENSRELDDSVGSGVEDGMSGRLDNGKGGVPPPVLPPVLIPPGNPPLGNIPPGKPPQQKAYKKAANQFLDLTLAEFEKYYLMKEEALYAEEKLRGPRHPIFKEPIVPKRRQSLLGDLDSLPPARLLQSNPLAAVPRSVDWRARNIITPVKDQGTCSASQVFAAVAAVEALQKRKNGVFNSLSEQEIIDCDESSKGCSGGKPAYVLEYIANYGVSFTSDYAYMGIVAPTCARDPFRRFYGNVYGYYFVSKNIVALIKAIARNPTIVALFVSPQLRFYGSGIFTGDGCERAEKVNHTVLAVGFDLDAPIPYIEFKNSWGTSWGDEGFFRMAIGPISTTAAGTCLMAGSGFNCQPVLY